MYLEIYETIRIRCLKVCEGTKRNARREHDKWPHQSAPMSGIVLSTFGLIRAHVAHERWQ